MKPRMIYQVEETRNRILDESKRMFIEDGLYALQMKDVAAAVGISRASLYRYYEDKFDLAVGVLGSIWDEITADWDQRKGAILSGGINGLERASIYVKQFWLSPRYSLQLLYMAEFDAFYSGSRIPKDFQARIAAIFGDVSPTTIEAFLVEGMVDGSVRKDIDPHLAGITVLNAIRGLQQRITLRGKALIETDNGALPCMTDELVRLLFDGLTAKFTERMPAPHRRDAQ